MANLAGHRRHSVKITQVEALRIPPSTNLFESAEVILGRTKFLKRDKFSRLFSLNMPLCGDLSEIHVDL